LKYQINFASYDKGKENRKRLLNFFCGALILIFVGSFVYGIKKSTDIAREKARVVESKEELAMRMEKGMQERRKHFSDDELSVIDNKLKFYRTAVRNKLFVTVFYNMLEEKTPQFITIKSVDFDPARKNFVLTGESLIPDGVTAFIPNLQSSSIITKVEITRQTFQKVGEKKVLVAEFEMRGEVI
jgi:hypothetical protein